MSDEKKENETQKAPPKKKEKNQEEFVIHKSSLVFDNKLYETILQEGRPRFLYLENNPALFNDEYLAYMAGAGYPLNKFKCYTTHGIGTNIRPQWGEEALMDPPMVMLPSDALPFESPTILVQEIVDFIKRYCDLPDDFARISAYYVILTYFYDRLDQIPYLSFMGDLGTGKSRCKLIVGSVCYHPILASAGTSPAAMYRLISKWPGTLLMDEADLNNKSDEAQEITKILNCGFDKYNPRVVCDKDDPNSLLFNNPFCPKIIARRFEFQDKAVESRCITQIMQQTSRRELPKVLPPVWSREAEILRNKLLMLRLLYWHTYDNPKSDLLDIDVEPRLMQAYTGLALVVSQFPGELDWLKLYIVAKNSEIINERASTWEGALVSAYVDCIDAHTEVITNGLLCGRMAEILGSEVKSRTTGRCLKALGFVSDKKRVLGKLQRVVSINADKLVVLAKRYGVEYISVPSVPFVPLSTSSTHFYGTGNKVTPQVNGLNGTNGTNGTGVELISFDKIEPHALEILQNVPNKEHHHLVFALFKKGGWPEPLIEQALNKMKREGIIYEPRAGFLAKMG